jgi:hypothetical protein
MATPQIDWDDPAARYRLSQQLGHEAYNQAQRDHIANSVVATVNGYGIRPVMTGFGHLFAVVGTTMAFSTLDAASDHALSLQAA